MAIKLSQKEISLDLQNQGFTNTIYSQQGDTDSRKLVVSLFDDGEEYNISSSSTVYLEGTRADDAVVHRKVDSVLDNMVTVLFKNEELCVKGIAKYKISIYGNDGSILSSVPFKIKVYENIYNDEGIIATPQYSELQEAIKKADSLMDDFHNKLDEHYFVLTEDKDIAGGVPSLDSNTKVPISELYEATTTTKGITQLTDGVTSDSTTTAATPNSVKTVNDSLNSEISRAKSAESTLTTNLNNEITRATDAESTLTTNLNTEITRAKSAEVLKAPLASPTLTGTPTAPTATVGTNTTQIATTAFVQTAVSDGIAASDALIFKGTLGTSGTITALPTTYKTGWTYRVITVGTYAGQVCEIGDLIVALVDRSGSGNLDADWCVAQTNINGAITGIKSGDAYITTSQSGSVVTIAHKDVIRTNTISTASPSSGGTFTAVDSVTSDSKGHITSVNTKTIILPTTVGTISLIGDVIGSGTFNGSGSLDIKTTVTNGGHYIGASSPSNTNLLWIDTSNSGILKYYDGTTWVEIAGSAEILDSMQSYLTRAQALYDSMYLDCDGETPHLRVVTLIKIKGGTPQQRLIDGGISFDGGTPTSRLLGA